MTSDVKAVSAAPALAGLQTSDPKAVAAKVQSMFVEVMLKSMEDSVGGEGGGLFGSGPGSDMYSGMFREQMATAIGGRMGGTLESQLTKGMQRSAAKPTVEGAGAPEGASPVSAVAPISSNEVTTPMGGGTYYPRPPAYSGAAISLRGASSAAASPAVLRELPVNGVVTSEKGWRRDPITGETQYHAGIDVAAPTGTMVKAVAAGRVIESGAKGGYGNAVVIATDDGRRMLYGHNSQNLVRVGDRVAAGDSIAAVGATGRATGPHVHFEVLAK